MHRKCFALGLAAFALAASAAIESARAECTCRAFGRDFVLGRSVCLATPAGPRLAVCGMFLNNTSWQFSATPCTLATADPERGRAEVQEKDAHRDGG
jgi:hypothetical protein